MHFLFLSCEIWATYVLVEHTIYSMARGMGLMAVNNEHLPYLEFLSFGRRAAAFVAITNVSTIIFISGILHLKYHVASRRT